LFSPHFFRDLLNLDFGCIYLNTRISQKLALFTRCPLAASQVPFFYVRVGRIAVLYMKTFNRTYIVLAVPQYSP